MKPVLLDWQASNRFAWGIVGLHIFQHWALREDLLPHMRWAIREEELFCADPSQRDLVLEKVRVSNEFARELANASAGGKRVKLNVPVISGLGNRYCSAPGAASGSLNIGRIVFEDTFLDSTNQLDSHYDLFICISGWNAELLREDVRVPVVTIHEAVDSTLFRPGPRSGVFGTDRFVVFAGGKVEFKKSQDLVLLAFKAFQARHPDSVLVVAWQSAWAGRGAGFAGRLSASLEADAVGRLKVQKWAADNGVDPSAVIDLGLVPNQQMPAILREVDCALVPSRCEGGTSMVAMEAMATGVPTILAANTGLRDLIGEGNCIQLLRQTPCAPDGEEGRDGWCESDVEEMVEALERLYASATLRREIGAAGRTFMQARTWSAHAEATRRCVFGDLTPVSAQRAMGAGTIHTAG